MGGPSSSPLLVILAATDFKVFRSLQNWLNGKEFPTEDEVRAALQEWIDSKADSFWTKAFDVLTKRWSSVREYERDYFIDH